MWPSTEGWATGLYLASAALRARPAGEPATVRGDLREIGGYLLAEVFATQPPEVREFLLQTAVLDHLSAALCSAVTERDDAPAVLARLAGDHLFVAPEDDVGRWYRYHQLFPTSCGPSSSAASRPRWPASAGAPEPGIWGKATCPRAWSTCCGPAIMPAPPRS